MCYSRHFILVLNVVDRILLFNQSSTCYRTDSKGIRAGIFFFFFFLLELNMLLYCWEKVEIALPVPSGNLCLAI